MADYIRPTPQNPVTGSVARGLRALQEFASKYEVSPRIPLLGGTGVDELLSLPGAASLMEDISYQGPRALIRGGNAATGGLGTFKLDPRTTDLLDLGATATGVGQLGVFAGRGVNKAAMAAGQAGARYADRVVPQIKGKGNRAPVEKYLPAVQDFVKSGQWNNVGDLKNTGLVDIGKTPKRVEALGSRYVTDTELSNYLDSFPNKQSPEGFAEGGVVNTSSEYNPTKIQSLVDSLYEEMNG